MLFNLFTNVLTQAVFTQLFCTTIVISEKRGKLSEQRLKYGSKTSITSEDFSEHNIVL